MATVLVLSVFPLLVPCFQTSQIPQFLIDPATLGYDSVPAAAERNTGGPATILSPRVRPTAEQIFGDGPDLKPLSQWYGRWRKEVEANRPPSAQELVDFENLLRRSRLSPLQLFDLAADMAHTGELPATCTCIRIATEATVVEFSGVEKLTDEQWYIAEAMAQSDQVLWHAMDAATLLSQKSVLKNLPRMNPWDQIPEWSKLGHAEALILLRRDNEALTELDEFEDDAQQHPGTVSPRQITEMHWAKGLLLQKVRRNVEAIPHLELVANDARHDHCTDAMQTLTVALAEAGRPEDARNWFGRWIDARHPPRELAICIMGSIVESEQEHVRR